MRGATECAASHFEIVLGEEVWRHPANSLTNVGAGAAIEYGTLTLELRTPLNSNTQSQILRR